MLYFFSFKLHGYIEVYLNIRHSYGIKYVFILTTQRIFHDILFLLSNASSPKVCMFQK